MPTPAAENYKASKLDELARQWDMTVCEFIEAYALDEVVPGICMNRDCDYTIEAEPDQREGWCAECDTPSVRSGLVLAGIL